MRDPFLLGITRDQLFPVIPAPWKRLCKLHSVVTDRHIGPTVSCLQEVREKRSPHCVNAGSKTSVAVESMNRIVLNEM